MLIMLHFSELSRFLTEVSSISHVFHFFSTYLSCIGVFLTFGEHARIRRKKLGFFLIICGCSVERKKSPEFFWICYVYPVWQHSCVRKNSITQGWKFRLGCWDQCQKLWPTTQIRQPGTTGHFLFVKNNWNSWNDRNTRKWEGFGSEWMAGSKEM